MEKEEKASCDRLKYSFCRSAKKEKVYQRNYTYAVFIREFKRKKRERVRCKKLCRIEYRDREEKGNRIIEETNLRLMNKFEFDAFEKYENFLTEYRI